MRQYTAVFVEKDTVFVLHVEESTSRTNLVWTSVDGQDLLRSPVAVEKYYIGYKNQETSRIVYTHP